MSNIRDAELALVRAIQCGINGGFRFPVSEIDQTPIRSVKDAKDYLDTLILEQRIEQIKAHMANMELKATEATKIMEAEHALQAVAEKVAYFAMDATMETTEATKITDAEHTLQAVAEKVAHFVIDAAMEA